MTPPLVCIPAVDAYRLAAELWRFPCRTDEEWEFIHRMQALLQQRPQR